eukprot:2493426-Pleurochrysis_carterae.AAC.3
MERKSISSRRGTGNWRETGNEEGKNSVGCALKNLLRCKAEGQNFICFPAHAHKEGVENGLPLPAQLRTTVLGEGSRQDARANAHHGADVARSVLLLLEASDRVKDGLVPVGRIPLVARVDFLAAVLRELHLQSHVRVPPALSKRRWSLRVANVHEPSPTRQKS